MGTGAFDAFDFGGPKRRSTYAGQRKRGIMYVNVE
jgi:hypothetical protein